MAKTRPGVGKTGLATSFLTRAIHQGKSGRYILFAQLITELYADAKANALFLLRDAHGQPVGAELRGIGPVAWRGMAPGSRKDLGFFSVPPAPRPSVILCESAIDAISCHVLHPEHARRTLSILKTEQLLVGKWFHWVESSRLSKVHAMREILHRI